MKKKNPRKWFLYLLQSAKDGTYYVGITPDLRKRLMAHDKGKASKYTRGRGPWSLEAFVVLDSRSQALKEELKVKKLQRRKKIAYFTNHPLGERYEP